jgi:hypothetical protein
MSTVHALFKTSHGLAAALLLASVVQSFGENRARLDFRFVNVADSTQGFTTFAPFPEINLDTGARAIFASDCNRYDMGDPAGAAARVQQSAARDGVWMIVEPLQTTT